MATVLVPLTQGKFAIIDEIDAARVCAHQWRAQQTGHHWYACRSVRHDGKRRCVFLHRFLLDAPSGLLVDHVDGDGLNCVRSNMRLATRAQNNQNRRVTPRNGRQYKGIKHEKRYGRWHACIKVDGKDRYLGSYLLQEQAARRYDIAARELFGEFARCNFPDEGTDVA